MSELEHTPSPETEPENQVFIDLVEQVSYVVDDAFSRMSDEGKTLAEFVQFDTHSIDGEVTYSVLVTESGGKPDRGVEKIQILARPTEKFNSIGEAAISMLQEPAPLPYKTDSYFIAHQMRDGEWRYSRVDEQGIYAWQPALNDLRQESQTTADLSLEGIDIIKALEAVVSPEKQAEKTKQERQMRQLDKAYARELIAKLDSWLIIPQN